MGMRNNVTVWKYHIHVCGEVRKRDGAYFPLPFNEIMALFSPFQE